METTTSVTADRQPVLLARVALVVAALGAAALAAWLGALNQSLPYALGIAALAALGLLRPGVGALALLALSGVDLIGTAEWGRFTLRASQIAALATAAGVAIDLMRRGELLRVLRRAPRPLLIFLGFVVIAAGRLWLLGAPNPVRGYAYAAWGLFDVVVVAGALAIALRDTEALARALRVWIAAATAIALFGLLQWSIGLVGGDPPFVTQWMGAMPRINGLSYEPSYFAFSVMIGESLAAVALLAERSFMRPVQAAACAGVMVVALVLASSRSGWIGLSLLTVGVAIVAAWRWRRLRAPQRVGLGLLLGAYLVAGALMYLGNLQIYADMARKGWDADELSSSAPRLEGVRQALQMARQQPVMGVGLGQFGGTLARDEERGLSVREIDAMVTFNLYAELLAETGLIGTALVCCGLLLCALGLWRRWRVRGPPGAAAAGALLVAGGLLFGVMYQFNQTLFRTDVWCLIGLAAAASWRHDKKEEV